MSVFHNNMLVGASQPSGVTFDTTLIPNSVWMDGSSDGFTAASSNFSNQTGKEFTLGTWFQLTELGVTGAIFCAGDSSAYTSVRHNSDNKIYFQTKIGNAILKTQAVFRDIGWYHLLLSVDTTQATTVNRVRIFVNGVQQTLDGTYPAQDRVYDFDRAEVHEVGDSIENGAFEGYLAQSFMIGSKSVQQGDFSTSDFLDTFTLGTNGSQVIPKAHSEIKTLVDAGSSNSYLLQYENSGALGTDSSTNTNNFTATSMDSDNQTANTPSLVYPWMNHLSATDKGDMTLTNGNLHVTPTVNQRTLFATTGLSSGAWYFEVRVVAYTSGGGHFVGIANVGFADDNNFQSYSAITSAITVLTFSGAYADHDGNTDTNDHSGSNVFSAGDIIGFAVDIDNGKFWYAKNNTWADGVTPAVNGSGATTLNWKDAGEGPWFPMISRGGSFSDEHEFRFEEGDFTYTAPSGFLEINSKNLTAPEYQGIDYFDTTLYEGNGQNQRVGDFVPYTDLYTVSKSAIFDEASRHYLARTFSASDAARTSTTDATISFWIKFCPNAADQEILSSSDAGESTRFRLFINDQASEEAITLLLDPSGGGNNRIFTINHGLLSEQEWVNFVFNIDVDNSTAANKVRAYVNGVEKSSSDTTYQNAGDGELHLFDNQLHNIGNFAINNTKELNSYLAELHVIDGSLKGPESFGQVDTSTNRWTAKDYKTDDGTYGGRGFYMAFESTFASGNGAGTDSSGNGFHFTESTHNDAWATTDQSNDTPTNNIAIFDGTDTIGSATPALSEGNTKFTGADNGGRYISGFPFTTGKFYWELDVVDAGTSFYPGFFTPAGIAYSSTAPWVSNSGSFVIAPAAGHWLGINGSGTSNVTNNYTAFIGDGDRMFFAYDADNKFAYVGEVGSGGSGSTLNYYSLGGAVTGDPTSGAGGVGAAPFGLNQTGEQTFYFGIVSGGTDVIANLIADPTKFNGTPPTGYVALTQDNMDATSDKITSWSWIKNRDSTDDHVLVDRIRGVEKVWESNTNTTAFTNANTVQRFLQRGVQIGNDVTVNTVNESYVHWQWLVGDGATTGSTTSPAGTIASTTIVADAGHFSVGSYTGTGDDNATVGHGLGGAPEIIIVRNLSRSTFGLIWHKNGGSANHTTDFASTQDFSSNNQKFGGSDGSNPTSDVFKIGTHNEINADGESLVFYALRSIPGVCKVGSFLPNNANDGPYVNLGFTPSFLLIKCVGTTNPFIIFDNKRDSFVNPRVKYLIPSTNAAEAGVSSGTGRDIDLLSDGFKCRENDSDINGGTSETYMYMAMAEIGGNGTLPPIYGR